MRTLALIALVYRVFAAGVLCFFALIPIYIDAGTILNVIRDPKGTPPAAGVALAICTPIAYFLLMLAWRAVTGRSPRKDGGLLPPIVLQSFAVVFAAAAIVGSIGSFVSGNYLRCLAGFVFISASATVFNLAKRPRDARAATSTGDMPWSENHLLSKHRIRHWMSEVGIPVLIPPEGQAALKRLEITSPQTMLIQLDRLAALGSNWAAAALASILLYPDSDGKRDLERARQLTQTPASDGDPYAQYVLAWVELLSGNKESYLELLQRAVRGGFSSAIMDYSAAVQPTTPAAVDSKVRLLRLAQAKGNLIARSRIFLLWISGRLGWIYIVPGLLGLAANSVQVTVKLRNDPFSPDIFCITLRIVAPSIRGSRNHQDITSAA